MAQPMGDSHRRFLQAIMSLGIVDESQANALHRSCCEQHGVNYDQRSLDDFIGAINVQLQPVFIQIRTGNSEEDGFQYRALVNMAETDVTRLSSDYAENELELFRKTMDLIVESESGSASSMDILNSADTLLTRKLKKKEAELVLQKFVQDKWLNEKHGSYSLSTRCIIEMDQYLRNTYQDLKVCHVCNNIALQSQICDNPMCGIRIHIPCVARFFKGNSDPHCPECKDFWPHEIPEIQRPPSSQHQRLSENAAPSTSGRPSTSQSRRPRR
ncbi:non-structural maintenance of chromosomes element 1 homolog [Denticeps clupeoides]|uniref:Non-structural maintenance of chromosomes element 1 homolog n=1 Tax=Denticeps clupeoides TaxID=299321 RepID=A0AAY4CRD1_9TELE|nr:non-structural maintenance of chromosomes element 1 homolog [Denticeps clupeoides]